MGGAYKTEATQPFRGSRRGHCLHRSTQCDPSCCFNFSRLKMFAPCALVAFIRSFAPGASRSSLPGHIYAGSKTRQITTNMPLGIILAWCPFRCFLFSTLKPSPIHQTPLKRQYTKRDCHRAPFPCLSFSAFIPIKYASGLTARDHLLPWSHETFTC